MAAGIIGRTAHALGGGGVHAGTVYLNVLPKLTDFEKVLTTQVEGASAAALAGVKGTAERNARIMAASGKALTLAITAPLLALSAVSYQVFQNQQALNRETEAVIKSTGGAAGVTADHVEELAVSTAKLTGSTNQYIQAGENVLLSFTQVQNAGEGVNAVFDRATQASLDLAARFGIDLNRAAQGVGRALQNPIDANVQLRRVGFALTQEERDKIKVFEESNNVLGAQKVVLDALEGAFGGAAEAAATPMDHLRVSMELLAESWGEVVAPIFTFSIQLVTKMADAFTSLPGPIKDAIGAVAGFLAVVGPLLLLVGKFGSWKTQMVLNFNAIKAGIVTFASTIKTALTGAIQYIKYYIATTKQAFAVSALTGLKVVKGDLSALGNTLFSLGAKFGPYALAAGAGLLFAKSLTVQQERIKAATEIAKQYAAALEEGAITAAQLGDTIKNQLGFEPVPETTNVTRTGQTAVNSFGVALNNERDAAVDAAIRTVQFDNAIARIGERLRAGTIDLDYYRMRATQLGLSEIEIKHNVEAAKIALDALHSGIPIMSKDLVVMKTSLEAVGLSFDDLNAAAETMAQDGTKTMGDWLDWIKENMATAADAIDQTTASIAESLVGPNNPFDQFADKTHFTTQKIQSAFRKWADSAITFGRDILKIQKASPDFAQQVLQSGNTALAHFFATHKKFTDGIAAQYDKTMGKVHTLAGTITHALMPVLSDIRRLLFEIARQWNPSVKLHDETTSKLHQIGEDLRALTSSPYYISVQVRETGTIPEKRQSGGFTRSAMTLVGEKGPELVTLPTGSYVHKASDTRRMMAKGGTVGRGGPIMVRGEIKMTDWKRGIGELVAEMDWAARQ